MIFCDVLLLDIPDMTIIIVYYWWSIYIEYIIIKTEFIIKYFSCICWIVFNDNYYKINGGLLPLISSHFSIVSCLSVHNIVAIKSTPDNTTIIDVPLSLAEYLSDDEWDTGIVNQLSVRWTNGGRQNDVLLCGNGNHWGRLSFVSLFSKQTNIILSIFVLKGKP